MATATPPNTSGKPGAGTSSAPEMHRLLPLAQEAVVLLCSLGQDLMLGQLRHLKVKKTEVGTPLRRLQAHSCLEAGEWVGAHLCMCKSLLTPRNTLLLSRTISLNRMSSDMATTSQFPQPVVFVGSQNLVWERSLDFFSPTSGSHQS